MWTLQQKKNIHTLLHTQNQINAIDEDFGEYGMLTYDIFSDEMKEYFSIDKTKGEIVTKIRLNREEQKIYELPIIATDGGGRSGFTTVKIKVGDVNDNAPEFYLREYKTSIYGNLSINATFLNVSNVEQFCKHRYYIEWMNGAWNSFQCDISSTEKICFFFLFPNEKKVPPFCVCKIANLPLPNTL